MKLDGTPQPPPPVAAKPETLPLSAGDAHVLPEDAIHFDLLTRSNPSGSGEDAPGPGPFREGPILEEPFREGPLREGPFREGPLLEEPTSPEIRNSRSAEGAQDPKRDPRPTDSRQAPTDDHSREAVPESPKPTTETTTRERPQNDANSPYLSNTLLTHECRVVPESHPLGKGSAADQVGPTRAAADAVTADTANPSRGPTPATSGDAETRSIRDDLVSGEGVPLPQRGGEPPGSQAAPNPSRGHTPVTLGDAETRSIRDDLVSGDGVPLPQRGGEPPGFRAAPADGKPRAEALDALISKTATPADEGHQNTAKPDPGALPPKHPVGGNFPNNSQLGQEQPAGDGGPTHESAVAAAANVPHASQQPARPTSGDRQSRQPLDSRVTAASGNAALVTDPQTPEDFIPVAAPSVGESLAVQNEESSVAPSALGPATDPSSVDDAPPLPVHDPQEKTAPLTRLGDWVSPVPSNPSPGGAVSDPVPGTLADTGQEIPADVETIDQSYRAPGGADESAAIARGPSSSEGASADAGDGGAQQDPSAGSNVELSLGDDILAGLNRHSSTAAAHAETSGNLRLPRFVNHVIDQILVADSASPGEAEVRLVLKQSVLPDTEVVLSRQGPELTVQFLTRSEESSQLLALHQRTIQDQLSRSLDCPVLVDVSAEHQDGRSRGQRDLYAEMEGDE